MSGYQGPNASVTQEFVTTPGAVAVESLPSVAVATAYDVYHAGDLGNSYGITNRILPWGTSNKVVFNRSLAGGRAFEMYPPVAYANTKFGNVNLNLPSSDFVSTGVEIDRDETYVVPGTAQVSGSCKGIMPYYNANFGVSGAVLINNTSLNTVNIAGGSVVTAQIQTGQKVFVYQTVPASWTFVGTVGPTGNDETKIILSAPYSTAITDGSRILVGAADAGTEIGSPENLYDPNADFVASKVAVGDIVTLSSLSIAGSVVSPKFATVTAIMSKTMLRVNTIILTPSYPTTSGLADSNFTKYRPASALELMAAGSTIKLDSYAVNRLVGFSQSYGLKNLNSATGVAVTYISDSSFSIDATTPSLPLMGKGDIFMVATANTAVTSEERDTANLRLYTIDTITLVGTTYVITTTSTIYQSVVSGNTTVYVNGDYMQAWTPMVETDIVADFRAIRSEENKVVHRITSQQDIYNAFVRSGDTTIDPRNELAFMMNIIFSLAAGKVCYGVNVDASAGNLSAEYDAALEELKLQDVYSHCFGTTDAGVNSLVGPYCDEESAPYEAHERIGIVCYDLDDIYLMGTGTGSIASTGIVTVASGVNPITAGVTIGDIVNVIDSDGNTVVTATVTATPSPSHPSLIQTNYTGALTPSSGNDSIRIESGRKDDQSVRGGAIAYGNRRVAVEWPGWFTADYGTETSLTLPPYFITAAIAGMDCGNIASQSFTNLPFGIPGLSNISLGTNFYFRKAQLDEIGGGGVDIMIQDATISQSIKSRHDLTSDMSSVQFRERSITKQADVAAKTIRSAVAPYVGRYNVNDPNLFRFLGQVCAVVSTTLVKDGTIASLAVNKIARDAVIDDKINFFLTATAYIAGNYYDITLLVTTR